MRIIREMGQRKLHRGKKGQADKTSRALKTEVATNCTCKPLFPGPPDQQRASPLQGWWLPVSSWVLQRLQLRAPRPLIVLSVMLIQFWEAGEVRASNPLDIRSHIELVILGLPRFISGNITKC